MVLRTKLKVSLGAPQRWCLVHSRPFWGFGFVFFWVISELTATAQAARRVPEPVCMPVSPSEEQKIQLKLNYRTSRQYARQGRQRRGDAHGHESPRPPRTALSQQREGTSMSRRGRAASEGRGRRCNRATGTRHPPFHAFLHLHTCAFSLISSACFLWQVTAPMRRREGQALRRKRPRYTKPATHGRLLAPFLAPICTPIDLARHQNPF